MLKIKIPNFSRAFEAYIPAGTKFLGCSYPSNSGAYSSHSEVSYVRIALQELQVYRCMKGANRGYYRLRKGYTELRIPVDKEPQNISVFAEKFLTLLTEPICVFSIPQFSTESYSSWSGICSSSYWEDQEKRNMSWREIREKIAEIADHDLIIHTKNIAPGDPDYIWCTNNGTSTLPLGAKLKTWRNRQIVDIPTYDILNLPSFPVEEPILDQK